MTTRSLLLALALAPTLATSRPALADEAAPTSLEIQLPRVCAEVEEAGLDPAARERAQHILERVLERADMFVVDRACTEVYRVGHDLRGENLRVRLQGPRAVVNGTAESTAQLGDVYTMMVADQLAARAEAEAQLAALQKRVGRSFAADTEATKPIEDAGGEPAAGEPAADKGPTVASTTPIAESDPYAPPPPELVAQPQPSGAWYVRAGVGSAGGGIGSGFAFATGYRAPVGSSAAFDASLGFVGEFASAKAEVFGVSPHVQTDASRRSYRNVYGGGGLSLSVSDAGAGLGAELTGGVSFESLFVQADLSLPFYATSNGYPAVFSTSLGVSFR